MHDAEDPVDRAFAALRRLDHPRSGQDAPIDAAIRLALQRRANRRPARLRRLAWAAALLLLGVGFTAAGGVAKVRRFLVVIRLIDGRATGDGARIDGHESAPDGSDTLDIELPDGRKATIHIATPAAGETPHERAVEVELPATAPPGSSPGTVIIPKGKAGG